LSNGDSNTISNVHAHRNRNSVIHALLVPTYTHRHGYVYSYCHGNEYAHAHTLIHIHADCYAVRG
jgi:hypothetical protein